jgi:tetratricopeptide (TPR) repeat protein
MHRWIRLIRLAILIWPAVFAAGSVVAQPVAPKSPDDYPFDPPGVRILFEANYFTDKAEALSKQGLYSDAEPFARQALVKMSMLPGQEMATTVCRMNLADVCFRVGKLDEAEHYYRLCLQAFSGSRPPPVGILGKNEPTSLCYFKLATVCRCMGRIPEAEQLCERGMTIAQARRQANDPQIAIGLNTMAEICRFSGRLQQAETLFKKCLWIRQTKLGKDHLDTAETLSRLGELYLFQRHFGEAQDVLYHCLRIREARLGPNHPDVAGALMNLADLCQLSGRYKDAENLNRDALKIREGRFGPNHPAVAESLDNLAAALQAQGLTCEQYMERSRNIRAALK